MLELSDTYTVALVVISHKDVTTKATVYVSDSSNINLLGRPQIEALGLIPCLKPEEEPVKILTRLSEIAASLSKTAAGLSDMATSLLSGKAGAELDKKPALDTKEPVEIAAILCSGLTMAPKPDKSSDLFGDHSVTVPSSKTKSNTADPDCFEDSAFESTVHGNAAPPVDSVPTSVVPGMASTPHVSILDKPLSRRSYRSNKMYNSHTRHRVRFKCDSNCVYEPP